MGARRNPRLYSIVSRHFLGSMENLRHGRVHTLATSVFSHGTLFHFGLNSLGIYIIVSEAAKFMTPKELVSVYCGAGVLSTLAEILFVCHVPLFFI